MKDARRDNEYSIPDVLDNTFVINETSHEGGKPDTSDTKSVRPLSFNSIILADRNDYSAAGASSSVAGVSATSA